VDKAYAVFERGVASDKNVFAKAAMIIAGWLR
jgi:hypothetical protein